MVKASEAQIDNLVSLLDGYAAEGGHHLNVMYFPKRLFWTLRLILKNILSSLCAFPAMP